MRSTTLALVAALMAIGPQGQDRGQQVFRSAAHAVSLDVAVFDGRTIINSLGPENFEVLDNGVPQAITSVDFNRLPIDLRLVFDTSGSISPEALEKYRRAMRRVADALQPDDRCEIVAFTTRVTDAAVRQSPPITIDLQRGLPDGTAFFDAVSMSLITVPSLERRQVVIVLSDALDNTSFFDEAALMEAAKRTDAVVYTVLPTSGAGNLAPFSARLESLSLLTGGRMVPALYDAQIGSVLIDAINEFRHSYVLRYTLKGSPQPGWHKVTVKVRGDRDYTARVRPGYFL
jgi:Ca-activated chloride channel family protein